MIEADPAIEVATLKDVDAIVALVESAYRGESSRAGWTTEADLLGGRRTDATEVRAQIEAEDSMMLVVRDESGLLACCHLRRKDDRSAYFGMFAVRPTSQGGGTGRAMLAAAEARAVREWSSRRMEMTVLGQRADLIAWYERRGYAATGQVTEWPHKSKTFGEPRREDLFFSTLAKDL